MLGHHPPAPALRDPPSCLFLGLMGSPWLVECLPYIPRDLWTPRPPQQLALKRTQITVRFRVERTFGEVTHQLILGFK